MENEKLIEQLRDKGCEDCPHRDTCRDDDTAECVIRLNAATALSTLQAENEKLRAELEKVKQKYDEAREAICTHCMDVPCRGESCYWWRAQKED